MRLKKGVSALFKHAPTHVLNQDLCYTHPRHTQRINVQHYSGSGGGVFTQFVHGRSQITVNPPIPTVPGRSTPGVHQPGRHCLHQAQSSVRCSLSRIKSGLHPSTNCSQDGLRDLVPTFFVVGDSANDIVFFPVVAVPETAMGSTKTHRR